MKLRKSQDFPDRLESWWLYYRRGRLGYYMCFATEYGTFLGSLELSTGIAPGRPLNLIIAHGGQQKVQHGLARR